MLRIAAAEMGLVGKHCFWQGMVQHAGMVKYDRAKIELLCCCVRSWQQGVWSRGYDCLRIL
jgi:hypothetical protein